MAGDLHRHVLGQFDRFAGPQVLALLRPVQSQLRQVQVERMRRVAVVPAFSTAIASAPPASCRVHTSTSPSL